MPGSFPTQKGANRDKRGGKWGEEAKRGENGQEIHPFGLLGIRQPLLRCSTSGIHALTMSPPKYRTSCTQNETARSFNDQAADQTYNEEYESAVKPGSVVDNHSSRRTVASTLKQPTRKACGPHVVFRRPSLFGLAPSGVFRAVTVASDAVRSYRTFSPLPAPCGA